MSTLYESSVAAVVQHFHTLREQVKFLPLNTRLDVYHRLHCEKEHAAVHTELSDLQTFLAFVMFTEGRTTQLHQCFQGLIDFGSNLASFITSSYCDATKQLLNANDSPSRLEMIKSGLALASFFSDAGWLSNCEDVLTSAITLHEQDGSESEKISLLIFECYVKLLHVCNLNYRFEKSSSLLQKLQHFIGEFDLETSDEYNIGQAYIEYSQYHFLRSEYDQSYNWSVRSLSCIHSKTPVFTVIDILRLSSKACVVKRHYKSAEILITQALLTAKDVFDIDDWSTDYLHPKIAELFMDYGFYLLNVDLTHQSVVMYNMCLQIRKKLFSNNQSQSSQNLLIANAHEELAYASYVNEYSFGDFSVAKDHIDTALKIMDTLLPRNHLLLAAAKRVKALIMEEIAVDHSDKVFQEKMLKEAEELHFSALNLSIRAYGESNVQTAKHYGNLGRLYQSMKRFVEAEQMHIKAISIKETLLDRDDYEVGLSAGHLASLYNYDLLMFEKAEKLYLKSFDIGVRLFGESYSGLEYDYRGLLRVYSNLNNFQKLEEYTRRFTQWLQLREKIDSSVKQISPFLSINSSKKMTLKEISVIFECLRNNK